MKSCTLCKVVKVPKGESWCPPCRSQYLKRYRAKRKEHLAEINRNWRASHQKDQREYKQKYYSTPKGRAVELCRGAKRRSRKRGLAFDITTQDILSLWTQQKGACLLTRIPFSHQEGQRGRAHYAAPSLDRIDPSCGYTKDNVRLICYGVNCCLHDFGEGFFRGIAERVVNGAGAPLPPIEVPTLEGLTPKQKEDILYRSGFNGTVTALAHQARKNAREKGLVCTLTKDFVRRLLEGQTSCALSEVPFNLTVGLGKVNPLRPSIDRVNSQKGYTPDNVRLVCAAINFGLNDFGEDAFYSICKAYLETP